MSWELLRTDYKDAAWSGLKKYLEIRNPDGTISLQDVTSYTVYEESFFGALDANRINTAVNAIMAALENGTDLYEVFTQFFDTQQKLFMDAADLKLGDFDRYIGVLEKNADSNIDELTKDFTARCDNSYMYFVSNMTTAYNQYLSELSSYLTSLETKGNNDLKDIVERLTQFETVSEEEWAEWFESVKDKMSGDIGAKIILMLDEQDARITAVEDMLISGRIFAPLATEDGDVLVTENNDVIEAFWYYATK